MFRNLRKKRKNLLKRIIIQGRIFFFFERHLGENFVWCFPLQSRLNSHARGDNLQVSNPLIGSRFLGRIIFQFQRQPRLHTSRGPNAPPSIFSATLFSSMHIFFYMDSSTYAHTLRYSTLWIQTPNINDKTDFSYSKA